MKKARLEKGITLIALIITIVILLILAAVTIGTVKDSEIIGHAQSAASEYVIAQEKEKIALAYSEYQIKKTINSAIESDDILTIDEATIEPIGSFGWKVSYEKTGNVYGINSKGEYDDAISTIIKAVDELKEEHGDTISVGLEDFIVYEDKYAIKNNEYPQKYIFYNWATVDVNDIDKLEARTITSQPENSLICDMSNRALAYDLNGDGTLNKKDNDLTGWLIPYSISEGMPAITNLIPEYTMDKNIKYSILLGLGTEEESFEGVAQVPVLFAAEPEIWQYTGTEAGVLSFIAVGNGDLKSNLDFLRYYNYTR